MRTGLVFYRLIGLLLAITTLCPSWISGPCCCTQTSSATRSAAACCSKSFPGKPVVSAKPKRPCCAARSVVANAQSDLPIAVRPISSCRCRLHLSSAAVSSLVRPVELTTTPCDVPVAESRQGDSLVDLQSDPKWNVTGDPDEPPDPSERCALLCRWLA